MVHSIAHKLPILKIFVVRPRLGLALLLGAILFFILPTTRDTITRLLMSWDCSAAFYLTLTSIMMFNSSAQDVQERAASQDEGALVILALTIFGSLASIVAIMHELVTAKNLASSLQDQAIGLAALTVFLSWVFMQTIFALHYAHAFYSRARKDSAGGLEFPGKFMTPDYWDFIYFSFIIGTAAQTADINILSKSIRRIVTLQCVTVFFFNTTILALAVNVGAGLVGSS